MATINCEDMKPSFHYTCSMPLRHHGDCHINGFSPAGIIYVDEIYGEDDLIAQYAFRLNGTLVASADEGDDSPYKALAIPADLAKPKGVQAARHFQFGGVRWRGMREDDRILDALYPLTVVEKIVLTSAFKLSVPMPRLLGLAESTVLAEAKLPDSDISIVCRRMRIAYATGSVQYDADKLPYDYDSLSVYFIHCCDAEHDEPDLVNGLGLFPEANLKRPMDCMMWQDWLVVADGGTAETASRMHVWKMSEAAD